VLNLFFVNDWRPIPDHDSYGHDVETAYLMLEAEDVLGHGHDQRTEHMARQLVDHALATDGTKSMAACFRTGLMHEKYGRETDVYFKAFQRQWQFIRDYQTDAQFHGVYPLIGPDGISAHADKGQIWKAAYHDGRALLNVTRRLQKLAEVAAP
jgi:mannobiose 2-epimerase